jgi:alkylhydroperoxidase family enzyme
VPWEGLDSEVRELIEAAQASRAVHDDTTVPRLWALRPELAKAQLPIQTRYYDSNILDGRLLELVRLPIAALDGCRACNTARTNDAVSEDDIACLSADDDRFSESERLALRFAELFAIDHERIDDELVSQLGAHFSPAEIVELGMYCGLMLGSGRFAHVMRGWADDEQPVVVPSTSALT